MELKTNVLYYGDNLDILRGHIPDASIDLVYLDPPFNSSRSYNILFKEQDRWSDAQLQAFADTWHWTPQTERAYLDFIQTGPQKVAALIEALQKAIGRNDVMAYLTMMAVRLVELHRVLKPTGSLYLHCDPTASHYLKLVLDQIFGPANFRNEIVWKRTSAHSDSKQGARHFGRVHDVMLFYGMSQDATFNAQHTEYDVGYLNGFYRHIEPETGRRYRLGDLTAAKPGGDTLYEWKGIKPYKGRYWAYSRAKMEQFERDGRLVYSKSGFPQYKRYLDEMPGQPPQTTWTDIPPALGKERLGWATQKPLALLERIIAASSNEGEVVLDPFCGCGTAVVAAHKLKRQWIGIDITHLAIAVMRSRLETTFPGIKYEVVGEPKDLGGARALAAQKPDGRYQFQWWALSLVLAQPVGEARKKGADKGIDGVIRFLDDGGKQSRQAIVSVKSGGVGAKDIRDLKGVLEREKAALGLFITLEPPTRDMTAEAVAAGYYHSPLWDKDYPKVQILTIEDLLAGKKADLPPAKPPFAPAPRIKVKEGKQEGLRL
ncbi:MAG: restriction endonuclease [Chloroflexi bacterium]|nr:restriction endonuclease [Chloroflexota bacterium]